MPLLCGEHIRKKLLDCEPVRDGVHVEDSAEVVFRRVESCMPLHDTSVVNQDRWRAVFAPDAGSDFVKLGFFGDVAVVEGDLGI